MADNERILSAWDFEIPEEISEAVACGKSCVIRDRDCSTFAVVISADDYELLKEAKKHGIAHVRPTLLRGV